MFKKLILALVCLSFTLNSSAAKLTATLQSGDKVTPFYGVNAFVEAYNAAVNGDVITLSPGEFKVTDIEKSITVIGTYAFSDDLSKATQFSASITVSGDNVTLEGIRFVGAMCIKGTDNLTINRCNIHTLNNEAKTEHRYHVNTILTDCCISMFNAMSLSQNAVLRNCSINYFLKLNESGNLALIENCNISSFTSSRPCAIYRNCLLGLHNGGNGSYIVEFYAPNEFHNNCFYDISYSSCTLRFESAVRNNNIHKHAYSSGGVIYPANGSFIPYTQDGVSYGPADHKAYPAIPSITSSEIDTKTDAEGNLHVKITATARD